LAFAPVSDPPMVGIGGRPIRLVRRGMRTGQTLFPLGIELGISRVRIWKELLATRAQILNIRLDLWPKLLAFSFVSKKVKTKMRVLVDKWVYWVWVWFYPKSIIFFMVFNFLKPYPPNDPTQPTLLNFFGWV